MADQQPNEVCPACEPQICDGCTVRSPWEHKCHELFANVNGEPTDRPCWCESCRSDFVIANLRRAIATLTRERDEARAEVERQRRRLSEMGDGQEWVCDCEQWTERCESDDHPKHPRGSCSVAEIDRLRANAALGHNLYLVINKHDGILIEDNCELGIAVDTYTFGDDGETLHREALATADTLDEALRAAASVLGKGGKS